MQKMTMILMTLLTACGTDEKPVAKPITAPTDAPEAAVAPTEATPDHTQHPLYIADAKALPPCDQAAEGWLVYLKTEALFKACQGGAWATVDIQGPKGDPGDPGLAGKDGSKGIDGEAGAVGVAGADGQALAPNTWLDPMTQWTWLIAGSASHGGNCTGDWRDPTYVELSHAAGHGLWAGLAHFVNFATIFQCGVHSDAGNAVAVDPSIESCYGRPDPYGIYCIKKSN